MQCLRYAAYGTKRQSRPVHATINLLRCQNNAQYIRTFSCSNSLSSDAPHEGSKKYFKPLDTFARRHIGPSATSTERMLQALHPPARSLDAFVKEVIPSTVISERRLDIEGPNASREGFSESEVLERLHEIASQTKVLRSYIGCGYAGTKVPEVIKRNVLEGPGWYTSYTPYQPEISQGRLESLLNFQTMVSDLTGLAISNASLLDEATAAAEAMTLSMNAMPAHKHKKEIKAFFVSHLCHPQTLAVLQSRAEGFGIKLIVGDVLANNCQAVKDVGDDLVGVLAQYPDTQGGVEDYRNLSKVVHDHKGTFSVATDLLALTVLTPPGEFGADVAFGNSQRFGVSLGFGGPHAAFFACSDQHKRKIPGRLVGLSKDRLGEPAVRLALQTREQHIRREKATSNICTAQVLLANMSAFYAVYHGPGGLKKIAERVMACAKVIDCGVQMMGFETRSSERSGIIFDTVVVRAPGNADQIVKSAVTAKGINLRPLEDERVGITLDETVEDQDLEDILSVFGQLSPNGTSVSLADVAARVGPIEETSTKDLPEALRRTSSYLTHPVFNSHHSETELLRYIHHLQSKDLSLTHSMIPLGSCTMKLNATTEMAPVTWSEFASLHPFVPVDQAAGYTTLINELEDDLAEITGFAKISLQPNSGAQGEFTALRTFRKYLEAQPGKMRDVCLIPTSAHGTTLSPRVSKNISSD